MEVLVMVHQVLVPVLLPPRGVLSMMTILDVQLTGFALNLNSALMVNHVFLVLLIVQKT